MRIRIRKKVLEQEWKSVRYSQVEKVDWGIFRQTKQNKQIKKKQNKTILGSQEAETLGQSVTYG